MVAEIPLVAYSKGPAAEAVRDVWKNVTSHLERLMPHLYHPATGTQNQNMGQVPQMV